MDFFWFWHMKITFFCRFFWFLRISAILLIFTSSKISSISSIFLIFAIYSLFLFILGIFLWFWYFRITFYLSDFFLICRLLIFCEFQDFSDFTDFCEFLKISAIFLQSKVRLLEYCFQKKGEWHGKLQIQCLDLINQFFKILRMWRNSRKLPIDSDFSFAGRQQWLLGN